MGFRVEGVTQASLTSDVFVACLFQHSWRGLAGRSPSAFSEGVRKLREPQETGLRSRVGNCKSPRAVHRYSSDPECFLTIEESG